MIKAEFFSKTFNFRAIFAVASGGGTPERPPPPKSGKIVVEIWCYLPEDILLSESSKKSKKYPEIFSKKLWKKSIFHRDFDQNIKKISLKCFQILFILGQNAQNFAGRLLNFTWPIEIIHQILMILHFLQIPVDFLQKFQEFSCHFQ